jgi:hypothetical protein
MTELQHSPTPNAVVRFRMRAMIWATTVVAILAAIAGPYFRIQTREGQLILLSLWSCIAVTAVWSVWRNWRGMWKLPAGAGSIDFILWLAAKRWWGTPRTLAMTLFAICTCVFFVGLMSKMMMSDIQSGRMSWIPLGFQVFLSGTIVAGSLRWLLPEPIRFCTAGVLMGTTAIPWAHIRSAEWAWNRPGVLRLHRLDGDIYAAAPAELRREVEEYLRQRTAFIGEATSDADGAHNLAPGQ